MGQAAGAGQIVLAPWDMGLAGAGGYFWLRELFLVLVADPGVVFPPVPCSPPGSHRGSRVLSGMASPRRALRKMWCGYQEWSRRTRRVQGGNEPVATLASAPSASKYGSALPEPITLEAQVTPGAIFGR